MAQVCSSKQRAKRLFWLIPVLAGALHVSKAAVGAAVSAGVIGKAVGGAVSAAAAGAVAEAIHH